jgi:hypothetical protein
MKPTVLAALDRAATFENSSRINDCFVDVVGQANVSKWGSCRLPPAVSKATGTCCVAHSPIDPCHFDHGHTECIAYEHDIDHCAGLDLSLRHVPRGQEAA